MSVEDKWRNNKIRFLRDLGNSKIEKVYPYRTAIVIPPAISFDFNDEWPEAIIRFWMNWHGHDLDNHITLMCRFSHDDKVRPVQMSDHSFILGLNESCVKLRD